MAKNGEEWRRENARQQLLDQFFNQVGPATYCMATSTWLVCLHDCSSSSSGAVARVGRQGLAGKLGNSLFEQPKSTIPNITEAALSQPRVGLLCTCGFSSLTSDCTRHAPHTCQQTSIMQQTQILRPCYSHLHIHTTHPTISSSRM